jgi:hypothetical protein
MYGTASMGASVETGDTAMELREMCQLRAKRGERAVKIRGNPKA